MEDNVIYQELGGIDLLKLMLNATDFQAPEPYKVVFTVPGVGEIFVRKVSFTVDPLSSFSCVYQGGVLDYYSGRNVAPHEGDLGLSTTAIDLVEKLTGMVLKF